MQKKTVWTVVAFITILIHPFVASAQDKVSVRLQPSQVTITEGMAGKKVNGYEHKARPVLLSASGAVGEGLTIRGHVAVPTSFSQVNYNAFDDKGKRVMSTEQNADLNYRDYVVGLQWQPVEKFRYLYAIMDYESTSYQRAIVDQSIGVIVNGREVRQTNKVQNGHSILSFGGGITHESRKFDARLEAAASPLLSSMHYRSDYSNTSGYNDHGQSTVSGHGVRFGMSGTYRMTKNFGLEGSWDSSVFRYQNDFDKLNDIHPQTGWNTYGIGVVSHF